MLSDNIDFVGDFGVGVKRLLLAGLDSFERGVTSNVGIVVVRIGIFDGDVGASGFLSLSPGFSLLAVLSFLSAEEVSGVDDCGSVFGVPTIGVSGPPFLLAAKAFTAFVKLVDILVPGDCNFFWIETFPEVNDDADGVRLSVFFLVAAPFAGVSGKVSGVWVALNIGDRLRPMAFGTEDERLPNGDGEVFRLLRSLALPDVADVLAGAFLTSLAVWVF